MEPIRRHDKRNLESIPVGSLGLIPLKGCENIGKEIDYYLTQWRAERESEHKNSLAFAGYQRPTYVVDCDLPRFGTGEGRTSIFSLMSSITVKPIRCSAR